jgi:uncharacterized membrane protein YkvA (DUF1232 family)
MPWWASALIAAGVALLLAWLAIVAVLIARRGQRTAMLEAARVLPDLVRLLSRLARDPTLPRGIRIRLWLLLGYLVSPVDIIPDFIPVIGYADDVVLVVLTLRSVVRRSGREPLRRHWPGSDAGLAVVSRLAGLDHLPVSGATDG